MAVDELLAETVAAGAAPALRVYRWDPPCLSLGRNQPARGRYDSDRLRSLGIDVVRRTTGGRAVLHRAELTYAVAVPAGALGGPRSAYATINRGLVAGLRRLGVSAGLQGPTGRRAAVPSLAPCFAEPAEGEVVAGGGKLVGSAQRRQGGVLLQHGSLPLEGSPARAAELLRGPPASADEDRAVPLGRLLNPLPPWPELVSALAAGIAATLGVRLRPDTLSAAERRRAGELTARYCDPAWTWHR